MTVTGAPFRFNGLEHYFQIGKQYLNISFKCVTRKEKALLEMTNKTAKANRTGSVRESAQ